MKNRMYVTGFLSNLTTKGFEFVMKGSQTKNGQATNDKASFVISVDSGAKTSQGKTIYQSIFCTAFGAQARQLYTICTMSPEERKTLPQTKINVCGTITFGYPTVDESTQKEILVPFIRMTCDSVDILDNNYKLLPEGVYTNNGQQVQQNGMNNMYQQQGMSTGMSMGNGNGMPMGNNNGMPMNTGIPNMVNGNFNNAQGQNNYYQPNNNLNQMGAPIYNMNNNFNPAGAPTYNVDENFNPISNMNNNLSDAVKGI